MISKIKIHYENQLPFVMYRKPNTSKILSLLQHSKELITVDKLERPGFIMAPFLSTDLKILIPIEKSEKITFEKKYIGSSSSLKLNPYHYTEDTIVRYKDLITRAIRHIKKEKAKKIVVSREEVFEVKTLDPFTIFQNMLYKYPNAYCYLWFHPSIGLWMGATPETLISYKQGKLKTMSLAGTRNISEKMQKWNAKEIEEQVLVTNYIKQKLNSKNIQPNIGATTTITAGNLEHLCTIIESDIEKKQIHEIVSLLYPTPAICGLPLNEAKTFITEEEPYNRTYYTGYLGEVFVQKDQVELMVNLRCMSFIDNKLSVYVGGGITASSDVDKEWEETVYKSFTIKNCWY